MLAACSNHPTAKVARAVRVEAVSTAVSSTARYSGVLRAQTQVDLAFRAGGFVAEIATDGTTPASKGKTRGRLIQAGDHVSEGMVLASLRQSDYRQRFSEAASAGGSAAASYRQAKTDYERDKKLFADGAISRAELDGARTRVDALAGNAGAAAARSAQMKLALEDTQVKSPLTGIVLERMIEVGALVGPGTPAFVLADTSIVKVTFAVPDNVQRDLSLGGEAVVSSDALPDREFHATITKIAAQANARTRVFDIEASIENPEGLLKVGMVATVQLGRSRTEPPPVVVPLSAVVRRPGDGDGFTVFVTPSGAGAQVVRARSVQLGSLVGNRVAVKKGLRAGEHVVIQGSTLVNDGDSVNIVPAPGSS